MINLSKYISEGIKLSSKSNVIEKVKILDPNDFMYEEYFGYNYNGDKVIVVGKPFKHKNTLNYVESKKYIKTNGYMINNDLEDIDKETRENAEWFIYATPNVQEITLDCYVYGLEGVYVKEK